MWFAPASHSDNPGPLWAFIPARPFARSPQLGFLDFEECAETENDIQKDGGIDMADKVKLSREEIQTRQQEIINLTSRLSSTQSDIGDWKITKTYEARLKGEDDPYDTEKLIAARQEIRERINELQEQLRGSE